LNQKNVVHQIQHMVICYTSMWYVINITITMSNGFPTSRNNKNTITKLDKNELTDESTSECKMVSDEEDVKDSISAATDKVGISFFIGQ